MRKIIIINITLLVLFSFKINAQGSEQTSPPSTPRGKSPLISKEKREKCSFIKNIVILYKRMKEPFQQKESKIKNTKKVIAMGKAGIRGCDGTHLITHYSIFNNAEKHIIYIDARKLGEVGFQANKNKRSIRVTIIPNQNNTDLQRDFFERACNSLEIFYEANKSVKVLEQNDEIVLK